VGTVVAVSLTLGCATVDSGVDADGSSSGITTGDGDVGEAVPTFEAPESDGGADEGSSETDGDGTDDGWSVLVWILGAVVVVTVVAIIGGVIVLIVRSGREQRPVAPQELPRTRPHDRPVSGIDDVAARARWVSQHVDEVMDAPNARELQERWHDLRDHMIDLEGRIAAVSRTNGEGLIGEELRRLRHDVDALQHSVGAYVSLTVHPDRTSDPDDYVTKLERAMDAVASYKRQVDHTAQRAAAAAR
jgi:hypothetical protein